MIFNKYLVSTFNTIQQILQLKITILTVITTSYDSFILHVEHTHRFIWSPFCVRIIILEMDSKVQSEVKAEDGEDEGVIETLCFENILSGGFKCEQRMKTYRKRMYAWSTQENYLYMSYLKVISSYFQHSAMAKMLRLFSRMSKMIKTRTPNQIKSHHQKMIMKYGSLEKAVKCMELQLSYELYESSGLFNQIKQKSEQVNRYLQLQQKEVAKLYEITVKKISEKRSNKIKIQQGIEGEDFSSLSSELVDMVALPERVKIEEDLGCIYKFSEIAPMKEEVNIACKVEME